MRSNDKAFARRNADDNFQTYYLATSAERSGKKAELKVVWKTNLHMLVMQQHTGDTSVLTAINETGWDVLGSDDNVQMKLFADGVPGHDRTATFGSFDSGTVAQVDPEIKCSIGFLDTLKVEISEDEWVRKDQVLTGDIDGALLLTPNEPYRGAQHVMLTSGAGEYRLKFYLMRGTQWVSRYGYAPAFNSRERVRSKCRER